MTRLLDIVDRAIGAIAALGMLIALLVSMYAVAVRYLPIAGTTDWVSELSVFLVIWVVLLSMARVERRREHLRVDFLLERMRPGPRLAAEYVALVLALGTSVLLVTSGVLVLRDALKWGETTESSLQIPLWIYYASLATAFSIHVAFLLERLAALWRDGVPASSTGHSD